MYTRCGNISTLFKYRHDIFVLFKGCGHGLAIQLDGPIRTRGMALWSAKIKTMCWEYGHMGKSAKSSGAYQIVYCN